MDGSNTTESNGKLPGGITGKGFVKGDKRINRKGRPKNFDALRELAQQISIERLGDSNWTRIEAILRSWSSSSEPQLQKAFVEIAYGKVKDEIEHGGTLTLALEYVNDWRDEANQIAHAAQRAKDDLESSSALQVDFRRPALAQNDDGTPCGD